MGIDPVNAAKAVNRLKLWSEARSLMNKKGLQLPYQFVQDVLIHSISDLCLDVNDIWIRYNVKKIADAAKISAKGLAMFTCSMI